ncbi:flagellar basal body L-ring protein FlgH [Sphingopyxis sp. 113P3]|jgi:Flagellar basal body L-ring protein|uniref:flagellar basal body L-ring protein FlgH n=1 Tax=Sphingopyxis sp. (strain 113P3) TaxID=292913 RepID=UPI0006AD1E6B|nr:flagellar basal body L-ring protein FlgH [Sphingopyxis sp. 113P3]ALC14044.1 flagellar L-ring protein FlgH [Sphingopyxis sp. 113P3]
MRRRLSSALILALAAAPHGAGAKDKIPEDAFAATAPAPAAPPPPNGAIFQGGYVALTSGGRAGRVGDIVTIQLVERTVASKSNAAGTQRGGSLGLTPPSTGPLSLFSPSDIGMGGSNQFKGKGEASQSNQLAGEISVTIAEVYPNGTMLVKGEKLLTLNRGDERVQISGLIRAIDIGPDNRVASTRVADANIRYVGKGEIARASRQGWLQRFFSIISPF